MAGKPSCSHNAPTPWKPAANFFLCIRLPARLLVESLDRNHLTFTTIRPADYPTPYEAMLKHNIQVGGGAGCLVGFWRGPSSCDVGGGRPARQHLFHGLHDSKPMAKGCELEPVAVFKWFLVFQGDFKHCIVPFRCPPSLQFSALDRKAGRLSTLMVRSPALHAVLPATK